MTKATNAQIHLLFDVLGVSFVPCDSPDAPVPDSVEFVVEGGVELEPLEVDDGGLTDPLPLLLLLLDLDAPSTLNVVELVFEFPALSFPVHDCVCVPVFVVDGFAVNAAPFVPYDVFTPDVASETLHVQVTVPPSVAVLGVQDIVTEGAVLSSIIDEIFAELFKFSALSLTNIVRL